jgi:hypothetical protein
MAELIRRLKRYLPEFASNYQIYEFILMKNDLDNINGQHTTQRNTLSLLIASLEPRAQIACLMSISVCHKITR